MIISALTTYREITIEISLGFESFEHGLQLGGTGLGLERKLGLLLWARLWLGGETAHNQDES